MRRRLQRGRRAAIVAVVSGAIVSTPLASSLSAITPGCTPNHCWSALRHLSFGPTYTGMYGTWNRAPMSAFLANGSNQQWLNSEMWFVRLDLDAWVETGVTAGWLTPAGTTGYFAYYAYNTDANVYSEGLIGSLTPNAGVTDEYQISRSGTTNKFTVWFDGQQFGTPDVGFWDANLLQMGGEVYTELGAAETFNMQSQAINGFGQYVNWPDQAAYFYPAQPGNPLNGVTYGSSQWSWNTKQ